MLGLKIIAQSGGRGECLVFVAQLELLRYFLQLLLLNI